MGGASDEHKKREMEETEAMTRVLLTADEIDEAELPQVRKSSISFLY